MGFQGQKKISLSEAKSRILRYCVKRERSHEEVRKKLLAWGIYPDHAEDLIGFLISENFLNEERFAKAFCRDKFVLQQWGRKKIEKALYERRISDYCIRKGLEEIAEEDYEQVLRELGEKKRAQLSGNSFEVRNKVYRYLLQRGFEPEKVRKYLNTL